MKFTSTFGVVAALAVSTQARDIFFYSNSRACDGNALVNVNSQRNICYDYPDRRFSSLRLGGDPTDSISGYVPQGGGFQCGVRVANAINGGCAAESNGQLGGIIGATWEFVGERRPVRRTTAAPCVEPNSARVDGVMFDLTSVTAEQKATIVDLVFTDATVADIPADIMSLAN